MATQDSSKTTGVEIPSSIQTEKIQDSLIVDAVFVIGTGSKNNNEELKYALRNLDRNCPFIRDVYISGECPNWVDKDVVKHLQWPDKFNHAKDANIIDKLRHACEQPGIAENILFCSDDQFQTKPCTWEDFSPRWLRQYTPGDRWYDDKHRIWHTRLKKTLERDRARRKESGLDEKAVYYYQPHMWMQISRDKFIEYAKWCDYEHRDDTIIASGYFNFADAGGKSNFDHVFISANQIWPVNLTHVAYSDTSYNAAMRYLKEEFPEPSRYEIQAKNESNRKGTPDGEALDETVETVPELARNEDEITTDILRRLKSDPIWDPVLKEAEEAERLRKANFVGWKKVWNDIIRRWSAETRKGMMKVPVNSQRNHEIEDILTRFKESEACSDHSDQSESGSVSSEGKKHCSKCEERRRKAREEQERRLKELQEKIARDKNTPNTENTANTAKTAKTGDIHEIKPVNGQSYHTGLNQMTKRTPPGFTPRNPILRNPYSSFKQTDTDGCIDCAQEHLSVAIAYLNSNAARPEAFDVELAKGEVTVAAQHLLALGRSEAYNKCIKALDSVYSAKSLFSVHFIREILRQVMDGR